VGFGIETDRMKTKKGKLVMKPVNPIERKDDSTIEIHLAADAANDDWIRAARLLKAGKMDELKKLEDAQTFIEVEEVESRMESKKIQVGSLLTESVYRAAKARAALEGRRVGALIDDAIRLYLEQAEEKDKNEDSKA